MILNFRKTELIISYTWGDNNHGICGHTFEVIDYFWILKDYFDVKILLCEDITYNIFKSAIENKYDFSTEEVNLIMNNTVFENRPYMIVCKNILFTDGDLSAINYMKIIFDKCFIFACGEKEIKNNQNPKIFVLQDHRIYETVITNSIEYVKKILFSRLKSINKHKNKTLLYGTKNCRKLDKDFYKYLESKYSDDFILLVNEPIRISNRFQLLPMPVANLFEQFNKYIYTPVSKHFDCSPRFIAECKYYNIEVVYEIDYKDIGLEVRREDLKHIESISLNSNDEIIQILKECM